MKDIQPQPSPIATGSEPINMVLDGCEWKACEGSIEDAEAEYQRTGIPYATHEGYIDMPEFGRIDCVQLNNGQRLILRTPGSLLDLMLTTLGHEEEGNL